MIPGHVTCLEIILELDVNRVKDGEFTFRRVLDKSRVLESPPSEKENTGGSGVGREERYSMRKREVRSAPTRSPDVIFVTIPSRCHTTTCVMASITVSNQSGLFTSNTAFTSLRLSSIFPSLSRQQTELFITYSAFTSQ